MFVVGAQAATRTARAATAAAARWRADFAFDPRLVGVWSYEAAEPGAHQLICETTLPDGVEAEVSPPAEKRISIGGRFLDANFAPS